jgi:cobalt-zinc-cadmium resistance protein CzcA
MMKALATVSVKEGPAQINRDTAKRRIVIGINVQDRDLGGL